MILSAFIIGLLGSIHCIGMCGPIACLVKGQGNSSLMINRLLYNAGRLTTYSMLGVLIGLLGKLFYLGGFQPVISVGVGIAILTFLVIPLLQRKFIPFLAKPVSALKRRFANYINSTKGLSGFYLGLFNGLLPCGLVYSGLAIALVQSSIIESTLAMVAFGIGTVPALFGFSYAAHFIYRVLPFSSQKLQTGFLIIVACLMIWRGISFSTLHGTPLSSEATTCYSTK